jgi:crossover junction endodeoxyribonuclease RusA
LTFDPLRFQLPWPPTLNHLYPTGKNGRRFLSNEGKAYHEAVAVELLRQHVPRSRIAGRVELTLLLQPPDYRKRDVSNLVKIVEDCLTRAGVWMDDCQIDDLHVHRCLRYPGGIVTVEIKEARDRTVTFPLGEESRRAPLVGPVAS